MLTDGFGALSKELQSFNAEIIRLHTRGQDKYNQPGTRVAVTLETISSGIDHLTSTAHTPMNPLAEFYRLCSTLVTTMVGLGQTGSVRFSSQPARSWVSRRGAHDEGGQLLPSTP